MSYPYSGTYFIKLAEVTVGIGNTWKRRRLKYLWSTLVVTRCFLLHPSPPSPKVKSRPLIHVTICRTRPTRDSVVGIARYLPLPPRNSPWNLHLPLLLSPANETCRNRRENRRRESVSIWRDNLTLLFGSSREIGWFRRGGLVTKVVSAEQLAFLLPLPPPPPRPGVPCTQSSILVVRNGPTCYYFYGHGRTINRNKLCGIKRMEGKRTNGARVRVWAKLGVDITGRRGEKWVARRMEWTSWLLRLYSVVISRKVTRIESRLSDTVLASLTIIHFCAKKKEKDFIQIEKWINFFAWKYQLLAERSSGSNSISTRVFKHGSITEVELGNGWKAVRLKLFQWQQVPLSARCL